MSATALSLTALSLNIPKGADGFAILPNSPKMGTTTPAVVHSAAVTPVHMYGAATPLPSPTTPLRISSPAVIRHDENTAASPSSDAMAVALHALAANTPSAVAVNAPSTPANTPQHLPPMSPMSQSAPTVNRNNPGPGLASVHVNGMQFIVDKENGTLIPCYS
jgi:hypothetical protein